MSQHQKVGALLLTLKETLVQHGHWHSQAPSDEKLASSEPFAVDTLSCTEWLQWIFIPKMQFLVDHQFPLPDAFSISPYVGEALKGASGQLEITQVTMSIDTLFSSDTQ